MKKKNIAIIPARGGSKRIPHKNIRPFFGKPIIYYSIMAALESGCFDEVMVSTDDQEIANICKELGAQVPFLRSNETANDKASMEDVALEVLKTYDAQGRNFNYFCCLLATAPFIQSEDIKNAMELLAQSEGATSVFTVTKFSYPIQRALKIENGWLSMQWPENMDKRSQELEPMYHDAGQFYCLKTEGFLSEKQFFSARSRALVMPETRVQDIDIPEDWEIAEQKFTALNLQRRRK